MYTAQGTIEKSHLLKQHQPLVRRIAGDQPGEVRAVGELQREIGRQLAV